MMNNFCFHVYDQKSLFIGNGFFGQQPQHPIPCSYKAGSQLKMSPRLRVVRFHLTSNKTRSTFHDVDWVGCGKNWCVHYNGSEWVQGTKLKVENLQFCEGIAGV